jgi:hypothetical protein
MHTIEHNVTTGQTTIVQFTTQEEVEYQARVSEYAAGADSRKASEVREERNTKLTATDWTQVNDAPVDKVVWATYRQALRDLPTQSGFPNQVVWPTKPE